MNIVQRGFTLLELLVVVAIIAIGAGLMSLALRDPAESRLEEEAARLVALFEGARGVARAADAEIRWQPVTKEGKAAFRFTGLPPGTTMSDHWIGDETSAEVAGSSFVKLGPEPIIGEQTVILRLGDKRIRIGTDGLKPFERILEGDATP